MADGMLVDRVSLDAADMRPHIAEVRDLQLKEDRTAGGEVLFQGTVRIRFHDRPPGGLMLRVTRVGYTTALSHLEFPVPTAEGSAFELPFELGPEDWEQSPFRPGPLLVDLCMSLGSDTGSASNCVVCLLADTAPRSRRRLSWLRPQRRVFRLHVAVLPADKALHTS